MPAHGTRGRASRGKASTRRPTAQPSCFSSLIQFIQRRDRSHDMSTRTDHLLTAGRINGFETRNRMIMAPMTRSRALPKGVPSDLASEYYSQRASAGLIITEGIAPSAGGLGYARTPAIENAEQIAAWKKITQAVHDNGGRIFAQFMHVG